MVQSLQWLVVELEVSAYDLGWSHWWILTGDLLLQHKQM